MCWHHNCDKLDLWKSSDKAQNNYSKFQYEKQETEPQENDHRRSFCKSLANAHGIDNAFGIIGSAFMPISDLFPKAGHHLLGLRSRGKRRNDGRWFYTHVRQNGDVHCAKWSRYHQFCHPNQNRILEPHADAFGDTTSGKTKPSCRAGFRKFRR